MTSEPRTILVVDDAPSIRAMVARYLEGEGYRVISADNGRSAMDRVNEHRPDLIVLDIMMPVMDGYAFLAALRRSSGTPVILLTAKMDEADKVEGFRIGADDYVTKPFSLRELSARIQAVMRRADGAARQRSILVVGDLALDRDAKTVTVAGQSVDLTPTEFRLLEALMAEPGRAFSRLELLDALQGSIHEAYERTIDVHVRNLRAKIEADPARPEHVVTVWGRGYRLAGER